jgi:hypothetical protein
VEHGLLKDYTPDGCTAALRQLIATAKPRLVLFPHTYEVRDYAPKLATSLDRILVSDVVSHRVESGELVLVRQLFQGKLNVDVRFAGEPPCFASVQAGAYRADKVMAGSAAVEKFTPEIGATAIRTKPQELFRESQRAVDLTGAAIIVSVGRGIKEAENIPMGSVASNKNIASGDRSLTVTGRFRMQPKLDDDRVDRETNPECVDKELPRFEMRQPTGSEKYTHDGTRGRDTQKYPDRPRHPPHFLKRLATAHMPICPCK